MAQPSMSSLEDLHTRWGPPPPTLDAAALAYICNGLTLERESSTELGLRRRQGWKMAEQVLTKVAAVLAPQPPADENTKVHTTPLPQRSATAPDHVLTPESLDMTRALEGYKKTKDYSAYLDMLMTPSRTGQTASSSCSPSSSTDNNDSPSSPNASPATIPASPATIPSSSPLPPIQTTTPTKQARPATASTANHPGPASPATNSTATNFPVTSNPEEEETETLANLHPLLLTRLNTTWSHLLDIDLASRAVEHRVARDLGALRQLRGAALDALLEELVVHSPPRARGVEEVEGNGEGLGEEHTGVRKGEEHVGVGKREYTAVMEALEKEESDEGEGVGLDWVWLGKARARVERELVATGALEYENE